MAGSLFDQGWCLCFFMILCYEDCVSGSFLSDSSKKLSSAAESQDAVAAAAKEAAEALDNDVEGSNLLVGMALGLGLTIVVLVCCVLARFLMCFKYVIIYQSHYFFVTLYSASACVSNFSIASSGF